jgi:hypothetical protein
MRTGGGARNGIKEQAWRRRSGSAIPWALQSAENEPSALPQDWLRAVFNSASVKTTRRIICSDIAVEPKCISSDQRMGRICPAPSISSA